MNKPKFTEGPWTLNTKSWLSGHAEISSPSWGAFALVVYDFDKSHFQLEKMSEQARANAQLIKSAPLLYKALYDMCYDYRNKHGLDGAYDAVLLQAEAALKEAKNVK
jgi:hypothetical protein